MTIYQKTQHNLSFFAWLKLHVGSDYRSIFNAFAILALIVIAALLLS